MPDPRVDNSSRDRIAEIAEDMKGWAEDFQAAQDQWNTETKAEQNTSIESIGKSLRMGLYLVGGFVVIGLIIASIALGKSIGRQATIEETQGKLERAQADTDAVAKDLAGVVAVIRQQRLENTKSTCEREERDNAKVVDFYRRNGASEEALRDARDTFPAAIDCEARVEKVRVDRK